MNAPLINNMEQTLEIQNGSKKIYKDKAIWVGTFLGGPLVAGYFIAENFKVFGEYGKAKKTWIYAILTTIYDHYNLWWYILNSRTYQNSKSNNSYHLYHYCCWFTKLFSA